MHFNQGSLTYDLLIIINEPGSEISNNAVCATSKASDKPAHTFSLIRALLVALALDIL